MGGAIAKCVLWGYRPWATYNGTPLAQYHQACTRMVRADYCGTGTSYTVTGNRISVEITELITKPEVVRVPGVQIGTSAIAAAAGSEG